MTEPYTTVLTIAGSDSCAGAGIQADLKTVSAFGCYATTVVTAVTAQNTRGIHAIHPLPADIISSQIEAVFADAGPDAVKIGMLVSADVVAVVAEQLIRHRAVNVVLDPVFASQSGKPLLADDAIIAMEELLFPCVDLITPNIPEASRLLQRDIIDEADMKWAARALAGKGVPNVLVKGGHRPGTRAVDWLYMGGEDRLVAFDEIRIETENNHGTGCTLAAAVAAGLASGHAMETAVGNAKHYLTRALAAGRDRRLGGGRGPLHHFFEFW